MQGGTSTHYFPAHSQFHVRSGSSYDIPSQNPNTPNNSAQMTPMQERLKQTFSRIKQFDKSSSQMTQSNYNHS